MSQVSNLPVLAPISLKRAAAYVRMSTEHQRYSIDNQLDKIQEYASQQAFDVVRIYKDAGKSGVLLGGRIGLPVGTCQHKQRSPNRRATSDVDCALSVAGFVLRKAQQVQDDQEHAKRRG